MRFEPCYNLSDVSPLPTYTATRYVQPLREGGSLPAVVETERGDLYVVKFRGAGHGAKALVAELIVGLIAVALGLPTPAIALIDVLPPFGRSEPDREIQDILQKSHGVNVGAVYLDGAFNFDALAAGDLIDSALASRIVWLDAFLTNPDRTHRNPNLLIWRRRPWLIDHGSALYAHHDWASVDDARTRTPFPLIQHHVLLSKTSPGEIAEADRSSVAMLSPEVIDGILAQVPDTLLEAPRARYRDYLLRRLEAPRTFVDEIIRAREAARAIPPRPLSARR
jgi:HipA-like protein